MRPTEGELSPDTGEPGSAGYMTNYGMCAIPSNACGFIEASKSAYTEVPAD